MQLNEMLFAIIMLGIMIGIGKLGKPVVRIKIVKMSSDLRLHDWQKFHDHLMGEMIKEMAIPPKLLKQEELSSRSAMLAIYEWRKRKRG